MIKAVLFDLGDTLYHLTDSLPLDKALEAASARIGRLLAGWGMEPSRFPGLAGEFYFAAQAAELNAYRGDCLLPDFAALTRQVAARKGLHLSPRQAQAVWEACRIDERFLRRLFPDAIATLGWLKERGYRLGCVTNTLFGGPPFYRELQADGLADYFEAVAVSCDLGVMKPHPRIFQHALQRLEASPQQAVMIGDSLRADVGGARALGMVGIWKRRDDPFSRAERAWQEAGLVPAYEPDYQIDNLWEITGLSLFQA